MLDVKLTFTCALSIGVESATTCALWGVCVLALAVIFSQFACQALAPNLPHTLAAHSSETFGAGGLVHSEADGICRDEVGVVGACRNGLDLAHAEVGVQSVACIALWVYSFLAGALALLVHQFRGASWADRLGEVVTLASVLVEETSGATLWDTAILKRNIYAGYCRKCVPYIVHT